MGGTAHAHVPDAHDEAAQRARDATALQPVGGPRDGGEDNGGAHVGGDGQELRVGVC